ncbi:hypothetical protein HYFRA_00011701 [Hymenoscyphus fraxineus]|uniref:Uncharacterized protein n=1 Tax=Hymenoscyphus fraxineus TaxID=746836 RepID=A0A9N9L1G4_9HELO|nr:hypothetical protein HYFRA_00011701 [Hymenoscyphus fraxineus]
MPNSQSKMSRPHKVKPVPSKVGSSSAGSLITPPQSVSELVSSPKTYFGEPIEVWSQQKMRERFLSLLLVQSSDLATRSLEKATNDLYSVEKWDYRSVIEDQELYFKTLELLEMEKESELLKPIVTEARAWVENEKEEAERMEAANALLFFSQSAVVHHSSREEMSGEPSQEESDAANTLLSMRYAPVEKKVVDHDCDTDIDERYQ